MDMGNILYFTTLFDFSAYVYNFDGKVISIIFVTDDISKILID